VGNFPAISHHWWETVGNGGKFPTTGGKQWEMVGNFPPLVGNHKKIHASLKLFF